MSSPHHSAGERGHPLRSHPSVTLRSAFEHCGWCSLRSGYAYSGSAPTPASAPAQIRPHTPSSVGNRNCATHAALQRHPSKAVHSKAVDSKSRSAASRRRPFHCLAPQLSKRFQICAIIPLFRAVHDKKNDPKSISKWISLIKKFEFLCIDIFA